MLRLHEILRPTKCDKLSDVETLRVPTWEWHGNAPGEVPRDGTPLQATANIAAGEVEDTWPPMLRMLVEVAQQAVGESRQRKKPVPRLTQHRTTAIVHAPRLE